MRLSLRIVTGSVRAVGKFWGSIGASIHLLGRLHRWKTRESVLGRYA